MRNRPIWETVLDEAVSRLRPVLPPAWTVTVEFNQPDLGGGRVDPVLEFLGPSGVRARVAVKVKTWTTAPSSAVRGLLDPFARRSSLPVVLVTDYVNKPLRDVCDELGIGYLDTTGWVSIVMSDPPLVIRSTGADRSPKRRQSGQITRLNGPATNQLIATLLELDEPAGVRALSGVTGLGPGTVSKIVTALAGEGVINRDERGGILAIHKRRLLDRWTQDYSFTASNRGVRQLLYPRGIGSLLDALPRDGTVRLTGAAAAPAFLVPEVIPVAPTARVLVYATDVGLLIGQLQASKIDAPAANLLVAQAQFTGKETSATTPDGVPTVGLGRVLADLMSTPGREGLIADQLIEQLAERDSQWGIE